MRVLSACPCHRTAPVSQPATIGMSCRFWGFRCVVHDAWFVQGHQGDKCGGGLVAVCSVTIFLPFRPTGRESLSQAHFVWRTVTTRCSSGTFGSSSHASSMCPVHTAPGVTWFSGVRSSSGHSENGLLSHSLKLDGVPFSPRPVARRRVCLLWPVFISPCRVTRPTVWAVLPTNRHIPLILPLHHGVLVAWHCVLAVRGIVSSGD